MSDNIPSKLSSILACKCPRCRKGNVFTYAISDIFKFSKTNLNCPHCNLYFEHETGFFWGAMYISYVFSAGIMIIFGLFGINNDWVFSNLVLALIGVMAVITPFSFRYSRIALLHFMSPNRHFKKEFFK
ncbi:MAG: DUF983 domain-containing protein [Bacteroidetes bacterium]|nr:DUF983 domain-containing protein [Bacteroidota bacterium]